MARKIKYSKTAMKDKEAQDFRMLKKKKSVKKKAAKAAKKATKKVVQKKISDRIKKKS